MVLQNGKHQTKENYSLVIGKFGGPRAGRQNECRYLNIVVVIVGGSEAESERMALQNLGGHPQIPSLIKLLIQGFDTQ